MPSPTILHTVTIDIGLAQISIDLPDELETSVDFSVRGIALIGHPHPLLGGSMDNKVTKTLAKTLNLLGYVCVRPNFRGVGQSQGSFDDGLGEVDDVEQILQKLKTPLFWSEIAGLEKYAWPPELATLPVVLAGFSFGSFVNSNLAVRLERAGTPPERLILIGSAAGKWEMPQIPKNSIVIHGEKDETITLGAVFTWLEHQEIVVHVIPGADHFFHRKLHMIRDTILGLWHAK